MSAGQDHRPQRGEPALLGEGSYRGARVFGARGFMCVASLCCAMLAAAACSPKQPASPEQPQESAAEPVEADEPSTPTAAPVQASEPEPSTDAQAGRATAQEPWQEPPPEPAASPEEVMTALTELGWQPSSELKTEDFAPMPPGAEGRALRMRRGSDELGVAAFRYPNPSFALPHAVDIRERIAVIPRSREALLRDGRLVIHLEGPDGRRVSEWGRELAGRLEIEIADGDLPVN